jgi:hypothetical protein
MYDVQGLVICAGSMGGCDMPEIDGGCAQFLEKLKRAVRPAPWGQEGWSLVVQNGLLIVRASEVLQRDVSAHVASERRKLKAK